MACEKAGAPFRVWALDSIVRMKPRAPGGSQDVLSGLCVFCKWPELGRVVCLNSGEAMRWFHCKIVCCYGLSAMVRTDQGQEFSGEFTAYLKAQGILYQHISTQNPHANRQIKRFNHTIKAMLWKFRVECPGRRWWDFL